MSKKVARMGIFVALAMIFSYIEVLIPFDFGIPGVKLGIANLVIVVGLYQFSVKEVFMISLVRILLMGLLFGNAMTLIFSLAGGIISFLVMLCCKKFSSFSIVGVSVLGGIFHNIGQLAVAMAVLMNFKVAFYLPILLIAGVVTGTFIGILSNKIVKVL